MIARLFTRRTMAALLALALTAVVCPLSASAQAPSPAAILIAKQIVELKGSKAGLFDPLVRGVVEKARDQFMQTNFMWAKDINEVTAIALRDFAPRADELVDATARIYATHFNETELKSILTFYQSPVGKKLIVEEPKVLDEALAYGGQWGDNLSVEVIARMRAEMRKRGHDL